MSNFTITSDHGLAAGIILINLDGSRITASYFEDVLHPLGWGASCYPVVVNASRASEREILYALERLRLAAWFADWSGVLGPARLTGPLDPSAKEALEDICENGPASASDIATRKSAGVKATAWNNRLAELHKMRLVRAVKAGRRIVYALPWDKAAPR